MAKGQFLRPVPHLFRNFHIHVRGCHNFSQSIELQQKLHTLVMILNRGPGDHCRRVTFVYEPECLRCGHCPLCDAANSMCEQADCPWVQDRYEEVKWLASQLLAPFRFLQRVASVTAVCPLDETLIEKIKSPDKSPNLFPRYLPLHGMSQRFPEDGYYRHIWFQNASIYGKHCKSTWIKAELVRDRYMEKLRLAVESGDSALFSATETELRLIVALTKYQIRAGIMFRIEAEIEPSRKMVFHLSTLQPGP